MLLPGPWASGILRVPGRWQGRGTAGPPPRGLAGTPGVGAAGEPGRLLSRRPPSGRPAVSRGALAEEAAFLALLLPGAGRKLTWEPVCSTSNRTECFPLSGRAELEPWGWLCSHQRTFGEQAWTGIDSSCPLERQGRDRERTSAWDLVAPGGTVGGGRVRSAPGQLRDEGCSPSSNGGPGDRSTSVDGAVRRGWPRKPPPGNHGEHRRPRRVQPHSEGGDLDHIPDRWVCQDLFLSCSGSISRH